MSIGQIADVLEKLDAQLPRNQLPTVEVRGEKFSKPILWYRRQWAITDDGLHARDGTYFISAGRLWEEESEWGWVRQMSEKSWVDMEDFIICLAVARLIHSRFAPDS